MIRSLAEATVASINIRIAGIQVASRGALAAHLWDAADRSTSHGHQVSRVCASGTGVLSCRSNYLIHIPHEVVRIVLDDLLILLAQQR
jgi:hypothetical protein